MAQVQQRALFKSLHRPMDPQRVPSRGRQRIVAHRIDCSMTFDLEDSKLGRKHRVRVRPKVMAASLIFEQTDV